MGHRVNLIIADGYSYDLYYSRWCANTFTTDLFWGPEESISFIKAREKVNLEIGSIRFNNKELYIFPLEGDVADYLVNGVNLLSNIDKNLGYDSITMKEWTSGFPVGGFHIDVPEKSVDFWMGKDAPGLADMTISKWQDWEINWNKDCFEKHIEKANSKIILEASNPNNLIERLKTILLTSPVRTEKSMEEKVWKEMILNEAIEKL